MTNPQYSPQTFIQIPPKPYFCFILTIVNLYGNYSFSEPLKTSSLPVKYFTVPVRLSLSSLFFFFFHTAIFIFIFIYYFFLSLPEFQSPAFWPAVSQGFRQKASGLFLSDPTSPGKLSLSSLKFSQELLVMLCLLLRMVALRWWILVACTGKTLMMVLWILCLCRWCALFLWFWLVGFEYLHGLLLLCQDFSCGSRFDYRLVTLCCFVQCRAISVVVLVLVLFRCLFFLFSLCCKWYW